MAQREPWSKLAARLGVTRVAKVTGLDRTGVEVACAVRPGGHVLQICNGKGERFEQAGWGAVLESAELFCAERVDPGELHFASRAELTADFGDDRVWDAADLGSAGALLAPRLWSQETRVAWRAGIDLFDGEEILIPAQAVHCLPGDAALLGPSLVAWSSNGMGAHASRSDALLHSTLEAVERDELATVLPEGWTEEEIRSRLIAPASLARHAPGTAALRERIEAGAFDVHLFDLTGRFGLPVAGALLLDREKGPVPLVAGYACRLRRDDALLAALLEAAQSRLTDIHGAREDLAHDEVDLAPLRALLAGLSPKRAATSLPDLKSSSADAGVRLVQKALRGQGLTRLGVVELAPAALGVHVVKVVIPGLQVSELL